MAARAIGHLHGIRAWCTLIWEEKYRMVHRPRVEETYPMQQLAPPPLPPIHVTTDDDGVQRLRTRLVLLWATFITTLVTAWLCTLGPIPAVIALVTAKHVFVAILVMGLGVDAPKRAEIS